MVILVSWCMTRSSEGDLEPFDSEIERTVSRLRRAQRKKMANQEHVGDICFIMDYAKSSIDGATSSIRRPTIQANTFEIKLAVI